MRAGTKIALQPLYTCSKLQKVPVESRKVQFGTQLQEIVRQYFDNMNLNIFTASLHLE
jgi:hypothetical protein